jgi:hypothetical protein
MNAAPAIDRTAPGRYQQFRTPYGRNLLSAHEALRKAIGYTPANQVIPDQQHTALASLATWDHQVTVSRGSWLWGISGSSGEAEGYRIQITDLSTRENLFSDAVLWKNIAPQSANDPTVKNAAGAPFTLSNRVAYLPIPRPVELLNVQLTNLSANPNTVQLVLWILSPPDDDSARNRFNDELRAQVAEWYGAAAPGATIATAGSTTTASIGSSSPAPSRDPALLTAAYSIAFQASAAGPNIIIPSTPGRKIAIHQLSLYNTVQQTIQYVDGTTGSDLRGALLDFAVGGTDNLAYQDEPHFVLSDTSPFVVNLIASIGATGLVSGYVKYRLLTQWTPGQ